MPVTTAATTSEPNTRLRFVVAASIILSLHGNVPRGFHRQHRRSRVDADPVTRDGTPHHPHVIWYPDSHTNGGHGCATVPDSHQLPHTTQASTHPLGRQRTHYPRRTPNGTPPRGRRAQRRRLGATSVLFLQEGRTYDVSSGILSWETRSRADYRATCL